MKNTTNIGNIGQATIINKFISLGVPVFIPFGEGYRADIIADFNGKLNKIQIKTTEKVHNASYMVWNLSHQERFHGHHVKYKSDEVDYFALFCIENNVMCLIPFSESLGRNIQVRLDTYKGRRLKTMHFVSDYKFETIIK